MENIIIPLIFVCAIIAIMMKNQWIAFLIVIVVVLSFAKLPPLKPPAAAPPTQTFNWSDFWNKLPTISQMQMPSLNWQSVLPGQIFGWKMSADGAPIALATDCPALGMGLIMSGTVGYDQYAIPSTACIETCAFNFPQGTPYSTTWDENGNALYFYIGTAYSSGERCNAT